MKPTPVTQASQAQPSGNWLMRSCKAIFCQRRLPTRAAVAMDRACNAVGWRTKIRRAGQLRFCVRRLTADEHYIHEVIDQRQYNPPGYEINDTDIVIDVGANIGAFSVSAAQRAKRVIAVEPVRENFALLRRNLKANQCTNVVSINAAVAGQSGPVTIHISEQGTGSHSMIRSIAGTAKTSQSIVAMTLAEIFEQFGVQNCQFLKLDCEGAEFDILLNLRSDEFSRIDKIVLEYHTLEKHDKPQRAGLLVQCLMEHGFRIDRYTDDVETNRGMIYAARSDAGHVAAAILT